MTNVLIIANDKRMADIRNRFQPLLGALILMVNDFDLGLKEVFEKRPAIVFIQDDIDGVSGVTVARHIKTLLRDQSPRMILLSGKDSVQKTANSWFDEVLPLSGSEQLICDSFKKYLDDTHGLVWKEILSDASSHVDAHALDDAVPEILDNSEPVVLNPFPSEFPPMPVPEMMQSSSDIQQIEPDVELVVPDALRKMQTVSDVSMFSDDTGNDLTQAPASPPRYRPVISNIAAVQDDHSWDGPVPVGIPVNGRALHGSRLWIYGTGLVVVVAIALYYYWQTLEMPVAPSTPIISSAYVPSAVDKPSPGLKLPAFISSGTLDRDYGLSHPGWERYVSITGSMEYLVFRDGGMIKAIQMIALKDAVIDDQFIRTALRDLIGSETYRVTSSSEKKGFLVENGSASGKADLLIYRKGKTTVPVAIVLTIP